jgi:excisionase family DNA binding protein
MKVREAATRLEVSSGTVYALVAAGKLNCHRVGLGRGAIRIAEEHLVEYLAGSGPVRTISAPLPVRKYRPKHVRTS